MNNKKIIGSAFLAAAIAGGGFAAGVIGMPGISGAQDSTTTAPAATQATPAPDSSTAPSADPATPSVPAVPGAGRAARPADGSAPAHDPKLGGHVGQDGTKEELLTGDTAAKVTAAAQAAVPDGTIERVENDAEGATYEAHMTKADGSEVTVKLDASFAVTGIETGHGGPGAPR